MSLADQLSRLADGPVPVKLDPSLIEALTAPGGLLQLRELSGPDEEGFYHPLIEVADGPQHPPLELLIAIGSALVHADEFLGSGELGPRWSPAGHSLDYQEFRTLMDSPTVQDWITAMGPLLPMKR